MVRQPVIPFVNHVAAAAGAVHSGLCDVVLVYHAAYRMAWGTASALKDPFRRKMGVGDGSNPGPETIAAGVGYTAWASRYIHEFGAKREHFGYVAHQRSLQRGEEPGRGACATRSRCRTTSRPG